MILLGLFSLFDLARGQYPSCGECWCIPSNDGLGPCPSWQPQTEFSDEVIMQYKAEILTNPYKLYCNPYVDATCTTTPKQDMLDNENAVCAFKYQDSSCQKYSLVTYSSREGAMQDNATVTHSGSCGLCSTATDLAIYLSAILYSDIFVLPIFSSSGFYSGW
jgi:hypothetical protein